MVPLKHILHSIFVFFPYDSNIDVSHKIQLSHKWCIWFVIASSHTVMLPFSLTLVDFSWPGIIQAEWCWNIPPKNPVKNQTWIVDLLSPSSFSCKSSHSLRLTLFSVLTRQVWPLTMWAMIDTNMWLCVGFLRQHFPGWTSQMELRPQKSVKLMPHAWPEILA